MEKMVAQKVEELVHAAFEKSWQFVSTDPVLAAAILKNCALDYQCA